MNIINQTNTSIITGFLGAGKTSFINQMITHFDSQHWALLNNEMGKTHIDATHIHHHKQIWQIHTGCICCSSQLPLQVGITNLLKQKPSHLIIEPSGLAHPQQLLQFFCQPHWQSFIQLKAVICLLNATQWANDKYQNHQQFQNHIQYANVVIVNRYDKTIQHNIQSWISNINCNATILWQPFAHLDGALIQSLSSLLDISISQPK